MKGQDEQHAHDNDRYAVPTNVSARFELFKGFGLKEIGLCVGAAAVGILVFALLSLPKKTVPVDASPSVSVVVSPTPTATDGDGSVGSDAEPTPLPSSTGPLEADDVMSPDYEGGFDDLSSEEEADGAGLTPITEPLTIGRLTIPRGSLVMYLIPASALEDMLGEDSSTTGEGDTSDASDTPDTSETPETPETSQSTSPKPSATPTPVIGASSAAKSSASPSATPGATPKPVKATGVTLSYSRIDLGVGVKTQLMAYVQPGDADDVAVTWISGDPDVAIVDSMGNITAMKAGRTSIIAASHDGGHTARCVVYVYGDATPTPTVTPTPTPTPSPTPTPPPMPTPSPTPTPIPDYMHPIHITPGTVTVDVGGTVDLTVSGHDSIPLTFTSSQSSIAVVDGYGHVTALAPGTATITAKTADAKRSTYAIVIVRQPVTSLSLDESKIIMIPGDTLTVMATVLPTNATDKAVTWRSNNTDIATVDALGRITAHKAGKATITATAQGATPALTASVAVVVEQPPSPNTTPTDTNASGGSLLSLLIPTAHAASDAFADAEVPTESSSEASAELSSEVSSEVSAETSNPPNTKTIHAIPDTVRFLSILIPVAAMAFLCLPVGQSQSLLDTMRAAAIYRRRAHLYHHRRED